MSVNLHGLQIVWGADLPAVLLALGKMKLPSFRLSATLLKPGTALLRLYDPARSGERLALSLKAVHRSAAALISDPDTHS